MTEKIVDKWNLLKTNALATGDELMQLRVFLDSCLPMYAVMDQSAERRLFRCCINKVFSGIFREESLGDALSIKLLSKTPFYAENFAILQIELIDMNYLDIFNMFLQDICERVCAKKSEEEACRSLAARLSEWLNFFSMHGPEGLSPERERGLYGELYLLRKLNDNKVATVQAWTGPTGADHDYQFASAAVEVKTTIGSQNQELMVSSERQLATTGLTNLFIFHLSVSSRRVGGETLNAVVDELRRNLPPEQRNDFEDLLFRSGYLNSHSERYENSGFTLREENFFEVTGDFPRIIESELRNGVGKVKYFISVPRCKDFAVDESTVLARISVG